MTSWRRRWAAAVSVAALAFVAVPGCGFGPGELSQGEATLTVTRDYGSERVLEATLEDPPASETVLRALDDEAEIETRYGGLFVHSIDGVEGTAIGSRSSDWFFYVNGIESSVGAAEVEVRSGDRIWWDYRDWTDAMRVPAVVGSWPQPFAAESGASDQPPVVVECMGEEEPCEEVADRLRDAGAEVEDRGAGEEAGPRVLVGPWELVGEDPAASLIDRGPATSGVFARFDTGTGAEQRLVALDEGANEADTLGPGAGLVAAVREGEDPPTWLVTGTDQSGVGEAAELLAAESLRDRYAVATDGEHVIALPVLE